MQITPQNLHIGDIVDIGFCMVVVGKQGNLKARLILRTITLLDATHTQVSKFTSHKHDQVLTKNVQAWLKEKAKRHNQASQKQPTLKKQQRFEVDEEDARKKLKDMRIDVREGEAE